MYDIIPSYLSKKYRPFSNSLPDVIAVLAGVKPFARLSCDKCDKDYQHFAKLAEKNKLHIVAVEDKTGHPSRKKLNHVYLSKSKKIVDFYRLSDPENSNQRPSEGDERRFARDLGYPKCCIENYLKNTQKGIVSSYFQKSGINHAPFYFNNFLHSISNYYLSFHLPCSLECEETKKYNRKIFKAIEKMEPELACRLRKILGSPLLVWHNMDNKYCFDDRVVVLFDGIFNDKVVEYSNCTILRTNYPNNKKLGKGIEHDLAYLKMGNRIKCSSGGISIYRNESLVQKITNRSEFRGALFKYHV